MSHGGEGGGEVGARWDEEEEEEGRGGGGDEEGRWRGGGGEERGRRGIFHESWRRSMTSRVSVCYSTKASSV